MMAKYQVTAETIVPAASHAALYKCFNQFHNTSFNTSFIDERKYDH